MHARILAQSECIEHSGRQFGGLPTKVGRHEHDGVFPISRHSEFGPHGDGIQGFISGGGGSSKREKNNRYLLARY